MATDTVRRYDYRMADDGVTIRIEESVAERLRAAADAAGEGFDQYVARMLQAVVEEQQAHWDDVERICDETLANADGIPFEEISPWLKGWGRQDGTRRPR